MLTAKPWKTDALIRLGASVLICVAFLSATATSAVHFLSRPHDHSPAFIAATCGAVLFLVATVLMLRRSWQMEHFMRNLAILLGCLYIGFFLMWLSAYFHGETERHLLGHTAKIIVAVLCFQGASLVLVHAFVREHGMSWRDAFGLNHRLKPAIALGVVAGLVAVPVTSGLQVLSSFLLELVHMPSPEQEAVQVLRASATWVNRLVLGVTAILVAPFAEEVLFRGILYSAIKQSGFPRLAVAISALVFSTIHFNLAAFLPLAAFAIALAWLYERTDNLAASITAHSVFNGVNFIMLFAVSSLDHVPPAK
jgi:membrane protease YdiL (CAAX protease family)